MTRLATIGLLLVFVLVDAAAAQNKPEDAVKKAIDAHGGAAALKKFPAGTSKIAGTVVEAKIPFTGSVAFSIPGKVRVEMSFEVAGQKSTMVQIVNGKKVVQMENDKAVKLSDAIAAELQESAALQELSLLFPLLDSTYTLTADKDATVDGRECTAILVKSKNLKETKLFFDKKSGYLAAMQRKGLNPAQKVVDELTTFSDYKTIAGTVVPMKSKVAHDGKPFLEIVVSDYKPLDKLDDKLFVVE